MRPLSEGMSAGPMGSAVGHGPADCITAVECGAMLKNSATVAAAPHEYTADSGVIIEDQWRSMPQKAAFMKLGQHSRLSFCTPGFLCACLTCSRMLPQYQ